jgi:hypothetical protein
MNKKTKMWLGVGVVAAAAYYFWNKKKTADAAAAPAAPAAKTSWNGVTRKPNPNASGWTLLNTDIAGNEYYTPRGTTYGGI